MTLILYLDCASFLLSLYSLYYAEACCEFAGPTWASLRRATQAPFKEMSQRRRAVGNAASNFDLRLPAPGTNALPLDHLAVYLYCINSINYCGGHVKQLDLPTNLTPKSKIMGVLNLTCGLAFS